MKKKLWIVFGAMFLFLITGTATQAASYEKALADVEAGIGIFCDKEGQPLDKETAIKVLKEEIEKKALKKNVNEEILPQEKNDQESTTSSAMNTTDFTRGSSIPTAEYTLAGQTYLSDKFSGSGWRYSGWLFKFADYVSNDAFGVLAVGDSMLFKTRYLGVDKTSTTINPGSWRYIPNEGKYKGYFATYNPVVGSYYKIN